MNSWLREAGKKLLALLAVLTLMGQSVLPAYADTADTGKESSYTEKSYTENSYSDTSSSGYTVSENKKSYALEYFDRIAVNSVKGMLTIRPGEDFAIAFPAGWDNLPSFSVQDETLVVSGRGSAETQEKARKSADGSVVVLGEDEPAEGYSGAAKDSGAVKDVEKEAEADTGAEAEPEETAEEAAEQETAAGEDSESENAAESEDAAESDDITSEIVITIPSGVGIDTMRIAMEEGTFIMTGITAGTVTIQSGGGDLVMKDVSLGTVDIYSDSGNVSMTECTFNSLNIGMGAGNVKVQSDDILVRCRMEIGTESGEITYNGDSKGKQYMQPGSGKRFLTIQIGRGNISIDG